MTNSVGADVVPCGSGGVTLIHEASRLLVDPLVPGAQLQPQGCGNLEGGGRQRPARGEITSVEGGVGPPHQVEEQSGGSGRTQVVVHVGSELVEGGAIG